MRKVSTDVKAGIWYTVGNFVNRGIAFISTPVFARMLTKEEYGGFSNFTAWVDMLVVITSLDLYASINRAYQEYEDDFDTYMSTISWTGITFTAFCYLIVWAFRDWAIDLLGMEFSYINMMFLYLLFSPATQLFLTWQRIRGRYRSAIFVSVGNALFSLGLSVVMVLACQNRLWGRIMGYVFPVVMVNVVLYGFFLTKGKVFVREKARYALMIAIPLIPHTLSGTILAKSDQFMIKHYCGDADLAVYSFAYQCSLVVSILSTSINQAYVPWLYRKIKEGYLEGIKQQVRRLFALFLVLILGVLLIAPEMVYILGGEKYRDAVQIMPIVMCGYCFRFLYTCYVNIELYCMKSFTVSVATVIAAATNVILNFWWIPRYGYEAAAVTTSIGFAVLYGLHYGAVKRTQYREIYDHKRLLLSMCFFLPAAVGVLYLYLTPAVRYFIIVIYITVVGCMACKFFLGEK